MCYYYCLHSITPCKSSLSLFHCSSLVNLLFINKNLISILTKKRKKERAGQTGTQLTCTFQQGPRQDVKKIENFNYH